MKTEVLIKELQTLAQIEKMQGAEPRAKILHAAAEQLTEYKKLKENPAPEKANPAPERKKSSWVINARLSKMLGTEILTCLECGNNVKRDDISEIDFCSKCGADMR